MQRAVGSGQRAAGNEQRAAGSGQLAASIEQRAAGSGQWAAVGTGREGGREGKMEGGRKGGLCKTTNLVFARVLCQQVARSRSRAAQVRLALPRRLPRGSAPVPADAAGSGQRRAPGSGQWAAGSTRQWEGGDVYGRICIQSRNHGHVLRIIFGNLATSHKLHKYVSIIDSSITRMTFLPPRLENVLVCFLARDFSCARFVHPQPQPWPEPEPSGQRAAGSGGQ